MSMAGAGSADAERHGTRLAEGGDVPVVTEAPISLGEAERVGRRRERLVLTAEERRWGRRRVRTEEGRELVLALPTGSVLIPGDVIYRGPDWYAVVDAAQEPVIAVTPRCRDESIRIAFEVGNRHFTLAIAGDRLLVLDDPAMEQLVTRLGVEWTRTRAVFNPVGTGHRHDA